MRLIFSTGLQDVQDFKTDISKTWDRQLFMGVKTAASEWYINTLPFGSGFNEILTMREGVNTK